MLVFSLFARTARTPLAVVALVAAVAGSCGPANRGADLVVTSFSPRERTDESSPPIQIQFDRPVVAADQVGVPLEVAPVIVVPDIELVAHWLDRQTLVITPRRALAASTRYQVRLTGKLATRTGNFQFEFVNRPLVVEGVWGIDLARLPPQPDLPLHFNQPVTAVAVSAGCRVDAAPGDDPIRLVARGSAVVAEQITVAPATPLEQGKDYTLVCDKLIGAGGDTPLAEPYLAELHTYPGFSVQRVAPAGWDVPADDVEVEIAFSNPVNLEEVREHLDSDPAVAGLENGTLDRTGTRYRATVNLATETEYTFTVTAGLSDVYSQRLAKESEHSFTTGDARPRLVVETGIYAVEPQAEGYPVWTRNVGHYQVECARVGRNRVVDLLTSGMDYDPWYDAEDPEVDWKALKLSARTLEQKVVQPKNKWHLDYLDLGKVCGGAGRHGLFLASFASDQVQIDDDNPWRYHPNRRVLANVTDLGILLKAGTASGLVWVTSIATGKPIGGAKVSIYTPRGRLAHTGTTGADGILRIPGTTKLLRQPGARDKDSLEDEDEEAGEFESYRSQRLIAIVEKGAEMGVVDGNWQNGIQTWNFGVEQDRRGGETRIRGFIQSDRGIYRPGETVHFKGLLREIAVGRQPAIPKSHRVDIAVEDARGSVIHTAKLKVSRFGGFWFDLALADEASLGDYYVRATIGKQTFRERFQVEEFRPVTYEVDLEGGRRHGRIGDKLSFDLAANYLFGAPVVGAQVNWSLQRRPHYVQFAKFGEYEFSDNAARGYYSYWGYHDDYLNYISDGEGETGKDGHLRFSVRDPQTNFDGPQDYLVHAQVTDETDQTISKQAVVTAHKTDFYLGLHSQEFVQAVGMPFSINAVAVDPRGKQVATGATLSLVREDYQCSYDDAGFRSYQRCRAVHKLAESRTFQIPATGTATERIMPKQPGEYIIRIDTTDSRGNKVSASSYVWILGKGEAFWSGDESARMSLIASKEKYRPGETARLVPRTNLQHATALITLERNGILDARVATLASPAEGISIPLTDAHAPNVFATVAMVTGRTGKGDRHRPQFKMGVAELKVSTDKQRLAVEVTTDKPSYQPGEKVTGTIKVVSKAQGTPVRAEVSLSVADEGVLQLIAYKTPDPMKTFYESWGMGIDSATNWNRIARLNDPAEIDPDEGGDSGGDASGQQIRSRFVSSAYWQPALITDDNGVASFSFDAPDNLTGFRLMAVAADIGSRFGSGERRITIAKPLLAQPVLPRFLTAGDQARVGVVVHNYTGAAGSATVTAAADGARLAGSRRTVDIPAGGSVRVDFRARTLVRKRAKFTFTAKLGGFSDGVAVTLPVNRPRIIDSLTLARGDVGAGGRAEVDLKWSKAALPGESLVAITVDRTGLGDLEPSLRYLIEYPYGCLEQTLSRFIPLTKVKDLAASMGMKELEGPKLRGFIRAGAAKVVRHQHADGHYSLWPSGPTYPHLTVYATYGLGEAKRAGVKVDEEAIKRGLAAIKAWANSKDRKLGPGGDSATVAMAAFLLADNGTPDNGLDARLYAARNGLPRYGQAFLLRAMYRAKAPADQIRALTGELVAAADAKGRTAIVREVEPDLDYYMSSDVRSTAITLSALLEVDPHNPVIDKLVAGLRDQRSGGGRWHNTQDNLYALVALADYARRQAQGKADITLTLAGGKKLTRTVTGNQVFYLERGLDKVKPGKLILSSDGKVRYSVRLTEAREDLIATPIDRGFKVTRTYLDPQSGAPVKELKTGQLVKVRVDVTSPRDRNFVAVVDPLPAGLEAVNTKLATSEQAARRGYGYYSYRYSWGWTHQELRDDRVLGFADRMRAGTLTLEYLARATLPGSFAGLPAHAEAMYQPEINGRSDAITVTVKK